MRIKLAVTLAALAGAIYASPALAAPIFTEYFNNSSNIDAVPGWSDGTNNIQYYHITSLSFSNASYSGTGNASNGLAGTGGTASAPRGIQDSLGATYSGELWISYLLHPTNAGTTANLMGTALNSASYVNANPNGDSFGLGYNSSTGIAPVIRDYSASSSSYGADTTFAINTTYLIVAKIGINATVGANNDSLSLWAFKAGDSFTVSEAGLGTADLSTTTADFGTGVSNLWLGRIVGATTHPLARFDAIRVSNASGDTGVSDVLGLPAAAVPEPASLTILGLGAAALLARRRSSGVSS